IAPVTDLRRQGITVSLGADGAACNNRLDMFAEMRLAATLQAMRAGPGTLPARDVVWMATRDGARTLGLEAELGQLSPGVRADVICVDVSAPHVAPADDPYGALVYACRASDVRTTIVDGRVLMEGGEVSDFDPREVVTTARQEAARVLSRAGLSR